MGNCLTYNLPLIPADMVWQEGEESKKKKEKQNLCFGVFF